MDWLEITVNTKHDLLSSLCDRLEALGVSGLIINDEEDVLNFLKTEKKYWDYVDNDVLDRIRGVCSVQFYLENSNNGLAELARIKTSLPEIDPQVKQVRNEDWENNWREYYKPIEIGKKLIIVPEWEKVPEGSNRIPLRLDPGLIFGTGSHATTQMCLEALEDLSPVNVLDLGCGSGILAIASLLLGASKAYGCDIDEKAPDIALENGKLNGFDEEHLCIYAGDIINDSHMREKLASRHYELVLANIVADVIIELAPFVTSFLAPNGFFVCSGIIEGRQNEVILALNENGLRIIDSRTQDGWYCFTAQVK